MALDLESKADKNIKQLLEQGYNFYKKGDFEAALRLFYQAWVKLPKPQSDYKGSGDVLGAIGDAYFRLQRYEPATEALRSALHCPHSNNDHLVLFRLGQTLLDSGQKLQARTYLHRAYRVGGKAPFEEEEIKYLAAISDLVI